MYEHTYMGTWVYMQICVLSDALNAHTHTHTHTHTLVWCLLCVCA